MRSLSFTAVRPGHTRWQLLTYSNKTKKPCIIIFQYNYLYYRNDFDCRRRRATILKNVHEFFYIHIIFYFVIVGYIAAGQAVLF